MDRNYKLAKRRYVIGGVVLTVVVLFIIRLFALQILSDDYRKNADSNAFLKKIQYPSRGVIYDRTGKLLVYNQPAYDITVVMKEITSLDTLDLCRTLRITPEFLRRKFRDLKDRRLNPGYSPYTNQVFLTQLSAEDCGVFQEKLFKFPGFYIQRRTIRQYNYNSGAHILGDIGEVSKQEMEDDEYYLPGDFIGKLGVERSYEKQLRGEKGVEVLLRDAHGRIQGNYMEGKFVDDHTFAGMLRVDLSSLETEPTDTFTCHMALDSIRFDNVNFKVADEKIYEGNWDFDLNVKLDTKDTQTVEVNEVNDDGVGLEKVVKTRYESISERQKRDRRQILFRRSLRCKRRTHGLRRRYYRLPPDLRV
mgnify:CR=1 FL=1